MLHFPPSAVMNYDETRVVVCGNQLATRRVVWADTERANAASTRTSAVASLVTFVAAYGSVFLSVYVMMSSFGEADQTDFEFCLKEVPGVSRRSLPRYYCWTESGYLNGELLRRLIGLVVQQWAVRSPDLPLLLFGDNSGCRLDPETISTALHGNIYHFFIPANTTHFLQPLDEAPFGALHRILRLLNEQHAIGATLYNTSARHALMSAAYEAERSAFAPRVIVGAFRRICLWPLNQMVVLDRAKANLGVSPTDKSVEERARSAAAAVIVEAQQRVAGVRRRVQTVQVSVERVVLHSPIALLEQGKKRKQIARDQAAAAVERE